MKIQSIHLQDIERSDCMQEKKLIVVEGASDGIGKTTQFELLKNYLEKKGSVTTHHFPTYGKPEGNLATEYLKGNLGLPKDLSPYFVNSLYAVDRAITWNNKLKKDYENNKTILLDRYTTSSIIYQSALIENEEEKKEFIKYIIDYEYKKLGIKEPDKVIFLTAPFDLITKLREKRKKETSSKGDIHENNLEYMKKVYDNALFCAKYLNWDIINCEKNGKMKTKEEIHKEIKKSLKIN